LGVEPSTPRNTIYTTASRLHNRVPSTPPPPPIYATTSLIELYFMCASVYFTCILNICIFCRYIWVNWICYIS